MSAHIRYEAMVRLKALLDAIPNNNGTLFGVTTAGDDDAIPCISIVEAIRPGETQLSSSQVTRKDSVDYLLTAWTTSTVDVVDRTAYEFLTEIEKVFAKIITGRNDGFSNSSEPDYLLGGTITSFKWAAPIVHPPADRVKSLAYMYIPFTMAFAYNANNPDKEL